MATTPTSNVPSSTVPATTTTTTATATRSVSANTSTTKSPSRPQAPHPSQFPLYHFYSSPQNIPIRHQTQAPNSNSSGQQGILYPVASSGRGFIPRPVRSSDQTVTVVAANNQNLNPGSVYHSRAIGVAYRPPIGSGSGSSHPHFDPPLAHHQPHVTYQSVQLMRPQLQQHHYIGGATGGGSLAPIKGIPVTGQLKAALAPSPVPGSNGYKNKRDRSRDDSLTSIRDRKVKISEDASLYALCRSWLRNGISEESQTDYGDVVNSLPRPLPMPVVGTHSPKKEGEEEVEEEEEESVDHLAAQDLLKRHINRAKKVRARLREVRLKRIARYKTRLTALLPRHVEQLKNENAS